MPDEGCFVWDMRDQSTVYCKVQERAMTRVAWFAVEITTDDERTTVSRLASVGQTKETFIMVCIGAYVQPGKRNIAHTDDNKIRKNEELMVSATGGDSYPTGRTACGSDSRRVRHEKVFQFQFLLC